jgi:hypothetical protein
VRLYIVTVGISLLRNCAEPHLEVEHERTVDRFPNPLYDREASQLRQWLGGCTAQEFTDNETRYRDARARIRERLLGYTYQPAWDEPVPAKRPERRQWAKAVGAELATLGILGDSRPCAASKDRVEFYCSDTAESLFCGGLQWEACRAWGWTTADRERSVKPIPGLTPHDVRGFRDSATGALGEMLRESVKEGGSALDELLLIGSGGYKASAAVLYHFLKALSEPEPSKRSLWFLYEDTDEPIVYQLDREGHLGVGTVQGTERDVRAIRGTLLRDSRPEP